jgi:alpha-mannosidase
MADATLRAAEALYAFGLARREVASPNYDWKSSFHRIKRLRNEAALVLHHDAITGTSRTTVVRDYLQRLTQGSNEVQQVSTDMLQLLFIFISRRHIIYVCVWYM